MRSKFFGIFCCFIIISIIALAVSANNPFLRDKVTNLDKEDIIRNSKVVMIVLDCSGSMVDLTKNGQSKMFAAKRVLERVLSQVDSNTLIGLRVYGSSKPAFDKTTACQDSILLVAPGTNNRIAIINKLREIKPSGATPISLAMRRVIKDMEAIDSSAQKSVVLISDGIDTCGYDPCMLANSLSDSKTKIQFNVVGFGLGDDFNAINQLKCISTSTEGKFYTAETAGELTESILDGVNSYSLDVSGQLKEIKD